MPQKNEERLQKYLAECGVASRRKSEELKDYVGIKKSIQEYGVDEKHFLDTLDDMVEQAFDDQCTGANPRLPLMSEIKDMYLRAYYGKE